MSHLYLKGPNLGDYKKDVGLVGVGGEEVRVNQGFGITKTE